jgi:hypothetical protein
MTTAPLAAKSPPVPEPKGKVCFWRPYLALAFVVIISFAFYLIDARWPYRYRNVDPLLEKIFASQVKIDQYHRTYFPNPGFVATDLTLRRNSAPDLPPVGSAQNLIVEGRWLDLLLLRRRVRIVSVEGLHIVIPPVGSRVPRVLLNFQHYADLWSVHFIEDDCKTLIGPKTRYYHFATLESLRAFVMRCNG